MMNIFMTASSFPANRQDWRGVFIRQLAEALGRQSGLDLKLWAPPGDAGPGVTHDFHGDDAAWLASLMAKGGIAHLLRTNPVKGLWLSASLLRRLHGAYRRNAQADLYHVNWLQNALSIPDNEKPLLVTVLGSDLALLRLRPVKLAVNRLIAARPAVVCPNAGWMVEPLRNLLGNEANIREVPFGIEAQWYQASRKIKTTNSQDWLAVTRLTRSKLGDLFEWAAPWFSSGSRQLHLFGPMQEKVTVPKWVAYHGPATPEELCTHWFPRATGLISLSRHSEGRPQVMLEAMAAGLPIIASNIAAHRSFLKHAETAWLCNNAPQFGEGLRQFETESANTIVGRAARDWVSSNIGTWDDCAIRYRALYQELIAGRLG